ncbi:MAG: zinc-binding dehydrogenase, partial [Candidatus Dormiibacterota bacterium]
TPDSSQPVELRDADEPSPAADELVMDVAAASLNRGELMLLTARPGWPPGQDVAGIVARAAADGSGAEVGTRVVGMADQGGWAERVAVPTRRVGIVPDHVEPGAAATLGVAGLTALRALRAAGSLLNARVLVTGASGGVGRFAVQLAALAGAEVTAAAASEDRAAGLRELGAAHLALGDDDLTPRFDVVMEGVGGASLDRSLGALRPGGVVLLYGAADREPGHVSLGAFGQAPHSRIEPFFIYQTGEATFGRDLSFLAGLLGDGRLRAEIGLDVSWRETARAIEALRNRQVRGKVVLRID